MRRFAIAAALLLWRSAFATDVDTCGQQIAAGDTGVLVADLDCSAATGLLAAVLVGDHATLLLSGHTIVAPADADGVVANVSRHLAIVGPGTVRGGLTSIVSGYGTLTMTDVTVDADQNGIQSQPGTLRLTNVDVTAHGFGLSARKIFAAGLHVTTNRTGDCILGDRFRGSDVTVHDCHTAITTTGTVQATNLDAHDNVTIGVVARRTKLLDSAVNGNTFLGSPLDILTRRRPQLVNTTCGVSAQMLDQAVGPTWGVCASD